MCWCVEFYKERKKDSRCDAYTQHTHKWTHTNARSRRTIAGNEWGMMNATENMKIIMYSINVHVDGIDVRKPWCHTFGMDILMYAVSNHTRALALIALNSFFIFHKILLVFFYVAGYWCGYWHHTLYIHHCSFFSNNMQSVIHSIICTRACV